MMASAPGHEQEDGGYEYDFVEEAPEKFVCSICTKVAREPHLTSCCGQHFCDSCLKNWFKNNQGKNSCPHCREEKDFIHILDKPVKREINELKIHCTHHKDGCRWIGELGNLETHLDSGSGCGYVEVECTNKLCSNHMKREDLKYHLSSECLHRRYRCEHCDFEDTFQKITTHHYTRCPEYPIECSYECGNRVKRKDMSTHQNKCSEELVVCPNICQETEAGARPTAVRSVMMTWSFYGSLGRVKHNVRKLKRKDLQDHLSNECYLRKYKCEHCGLEGTYEKITGMKRRGGRCHYDKCPEYPLECPNKCMSLPIKRKDMSAHRAKCPKEPVKCPYKESGCETKLVRRDLDDHVKTQTQQHLRLTFQKMQALSKTCETLKKNNNELRKRCDELEKAQTQVKSIV